MNISNDKAAMTQAKDPFVLKEIINTLPYYIFWKDVNLNYLGVSKILADAAGFSSPDEMIGKSDYDCCWTKEESDFFRSIDKKIMDEKKPILNIEEPQKQLDGTTRTLLTSKVPLLGPDGESVGILGIYTDITDRKNLELEKDKALSELQKIQKVMVYQEKMKSLGEMAGGIAHEINNPLAIISGKASLISRMLKTGNTDEEKMKESCDSIVKTAKRCSVIIDNLKNFSRDGDEVDICPVNLRDILSVTLSFSAEKIKLSGTKLTVNNDQDCIVNCKSISIEQALTNLIQNATDEIIKQKYGEIIIETFQNSKRKGISVKNEGEMIPEEVQEKLFEPFFTTKPVGKGTGLGFSTSKGLVEKSGGQLVYHRVDNFNSFDISFPISQSKEISKAKGRVMIIDDEPQIVSLIKEHLEIEHNFDIDAFTDPQEALQSINNETHYDLVISDIMMPGIDGVSLLETIREKKSKIPFVVMMSGFSNYSEEELANKGSNLFLTKPLDIDQLLSFIEKMSHASEAS